MRLGGAFPLSITDVASGGNSLSLPSGGIFYPPAGNYDVWPGVQTVVQMWDPVAQAWHGVGQPQTGPLNFDGDGYNWRFVNMSGVVSGASITGAGSGATNGIGATATGVTIAFAAPSSPGITATAYPIVGGSVGAPTVSQAGTGFLFPPLVVIDPPPLGGIQAVAHATLTAPGGGIASIVMDNAGAGYLTYPNFYIIPQLGQYAGSTTGGGVVAAGVVPPPGQVNAGSALSGYTPAFTGTTGALLAAGVLTGSGTLTGIVMVNYGSLYTGTTIPAITITGCGAAAATALMSMCVTSVSVAAAGATYGAGNPPMWETSLGLIASQVGNVQFLPRAARGVTTVAGGAVTAFVIEDPGFGLQKVPLVAVLNTSAVPGTIAQGTAVCGGVNDISQLQARIGS